MATQNATNTSNPVTVAQGGTGDATLTAYAVLAGGTTSTAAVQSVSGVGTSGQLLVSNGASALPTWQTNTATAAWNLIRTATASSSANIIFTSSDITSTYVEYAVVFTNISNATGTVTFNMDWSVNNSTYLSSAFVSGLLWNPYNSNTITNVSSTSTNPLTLSITNTGVLLNGILFINLPTSASAAYNGNLFLIDTTSNSIRCFGGNTGTTTINNMRFSYSSGNITSGTISLYGLIT
jgi:hypothetical protein